MKNYTFSVTLLASITVEAASRDEAERIIRGVCEGGHICVSEDESDDADVVEGKCDVEGELDFDHAE